MKLTLLSYVSWIPVLIFWSSFSSGWEDIEDACSMNHTGDSFVCTFIENEVENEIGFERKAGSQTSSDGTRETVLSVSANLAPFRFVGSHVYIRDSEGKTIFRSQIMSLCQETTSKCSIEFYIPDDNLVKVEITFGYVDHSLGHVRVYRYMLPKTE